MVRSGVVRGICKAAIGLIAAGTVACGVGLLNVVVRPGTIEGVGTLALLGVTGLIVLPPFTLAMFAFEWWRPRASRPVRGVPDQGVVPKPVGFTSPVIASSGVVSPLPVGVRQAESASPSVARNARARVCSVSTARRGVGVAVMGSVAAELSGSGGVDVRSGPVCEARVAKHDGPRREGRRRRSAHEAVPPTSAAGSGVGGGGFRESLSDSMMGFAVTAG
ncbi:MAG: hypothetical protein AAF297_07865 [Planctomycetota bacterium]